MDIEKTKSWIQSCLSQPHSSLNLEDSMDKKQLTTEFLEDIKCIFQHYLKAFDELKSEGLKSQGLKAGVPAQVKEKIKRSIFIYDLSDEKGFMLFKQGFKLVFSSLCPGQIRIQFFSQKLFGEKDCLVDTQLQLVYNEMMSVNWLHENKKGFVDKDILVRYYMKRFLDEK